MNNKKCIVNLEYFREMLHICLRLPNQTFDELPFEEEILAFLRYLGHSGEIKKITDAQILWGMYHKKNVDFAYLMWEDFVYKVEHKDAKKSNEMYYPRFLKVIIHFFMTNDPSIPRRNKLGAILPIELTNEDIRNSVAYKEYYVVASGAAPPKTKATKGKQPAKSSKAKGLSVLSEVAMTEAEQIKVPDVPTDESDEEISWKSSDEDDDDEVNDKSDDQEDEDDQDDDDQKDDDPDDNDDDQDTDNDGDDFVLPNLSIHEEEVKDEESFDPTVQIPKNPDDEGSDDSSLGMNVGGEEGQDAEDDDEELFDHRLKTLEANFYEFVQTNQFAGAVSSILGIVERYMDQWTNEAVKVAVQLQSNSLRDEAQTENEDFINKLGKNIQNIIKEQVKVQVFKILPKIKKTFNEQLEAKVLTQSSNSSKTSYVVAADLSELKLKKILIEKIEYTFTLKRRRDDAVKDKEPFAGSDRGSKRRREGKEPESTSAPKENETKATGKSTEGSKSHQKTPSESAPAEEPMQTTQDLEEPSHQEFKTGVVDDQPITEAFQHSEWFQKQKKYPTPDRAWNKTLLTTHESIQPWISDLAKKADSRSSFNEMMDTPVDFSAFLMNRLKGLAELKFLLEEVYKATTNQLDWNNPKGHQYPHNMLKPLPLIPNSQGHRVIPFDHFINNDLEYLRSGASSLKYITYVTKTKVTDYGHIKWIKDLFYGFAVNRESARDVYSNIESSLSLNFISSNGIITSIWIGSLKADKSHGVKSYQKNLNLTKPDAYLSDLKHKEAYTVYSNPRGFIYMNKEKQNRLMRIDELHKFSDGTLNDVQTTLDDRLKGIQMKYLP
nr:hypothetical protein [Tanacetum cinerariifolium]